MTENLQEKWRVNNQKVLKIVQILDGNLQVKFAPKLSSK